MRRAVIIAVALLLAAPASGQAARSLTFGSTLNAPPTPSDPPASCDTSGVTAQDIGPCTRVALGYPATGAVFSRVTAPISGTITRVRVRGGTPGTVRVTLVRVRNLDKPGAEGEAQAVSRGALLRVQAERPSRPIESFKVNLKAHRGDYLALQGSSFSALRCVGGETEQLLFFPPLSPFGAWRREGGFDDCTLLVQATVTPPKKKAATRKRARAARAAASEPRVSVHLIDTTLKAVRTRGALRLHVSTDEPVTIRVSVKRGRTTFAGGLNRVGASGGNVTLKLTKAGRKLARKRSLRLSLVARASDAAQNKVSTKGSFTLG